MVVADIGGGRGAVVAVYVADDQEGQLGQVVREQLLQAAHRARVVALPAHRRGCVAARVLPVRQPRRASTLPP